MRIFCIILSLIAFVSCNRNKDLNKVSIETVSVNLEKNKTSPISECIEKIEIIPLQTDTNCLVSDYNKLSYYKEIEAFIILDKDYVVSVFSKEGKFIANSRSKKGQGPEEYWLIVDVVYNPFSKAIELLNPYSMIYRYDTTFCFLEKIAMDQNDLVFSRFFPTGINRYVQTPAVLRNTDAVMYFCDYEKKTISPPVEYEEGFISTITMNYNFFFNVDEKLFFSPLGIDYHFYRIDPDNQTLNPVMRLDFGNKEIQKEKLKKMGAYSSKSRNREKNRDVDIEKMRKVNDYLFTSGYSLPMIKFFNEQYIYVHVSENYSKSNFIYNRKTKKSFLHPSGSSLEACPFLALEDNVLIALIPPYLLEEYIDRQYMNEENLMKLDKIEEEDNPVIVKYYLQ